MLQALRFAFCIGLGFSIFYSLWQLALVLTFIKRHPARKEPVNLPVSVLRPLAGITELSDSLLETLCRQTLVPAEIRYGVDSPDDPAVSVVKRLQERFPQIPMSLQVGPYGNAPNRKIAKLALLSAPCHSPILMAVDQDIAMPINHLKDILSHFSDPKTGMVTCLYRIRKPQTWPSAMELLSIHADFFPSVLTGEQLDGGLRYAFGATLAVRHDVLEKVGGFGSLADFLADDHELGARVWKAGYRVVLSGSIAEHAPGNLSFKAYCDRQIRAARTHRVCRPAGYALSLLIQGLPWAIGLVFLSGFSLPVSAMIFFWIFARLLAATSSHLLLTEGEGPFWPLSLLPIHEMARFVFWCFAFSGNRVTWGRRRYKVRRDGRMSNVGEETN